MLGLCRERLSCGQMDGRAAEENWYLLWQREAFDLLEWTGQCASKDSPKWACLAPSPQPQTDDEAGQVVFSHPIPALLTAA